jgi:hypothetical protein
MTQLRTVTTAAFVFLVGASSCGGSGDGTGDPSPGGGGLGGAAAGGQSSSSGGSGVGPQDVCAGYPPECVPICQAGICDCYCPPATGGAAGEGGAPSAASGGSGQTDCDCALAGYEPVCGVDGNTHDAICGADCVPVDIDCLGECPCDGESSDCDIGCTAVPDSSWCDRPTVEWLCDGNAREDLLVEVGCENLATGAIRYCCPAGFLSACQ